MSEKIKRPESLDGDSRLKRTGCGNMYITVNELDGIVMEVFASLGKAGGCASSQCEALGRVISIALQCGTPAIEIVKTLKGIKCHESPKNLVGVHSCADAIARAIEEHLNGKQARDAT